MVKWYTKEHEYTLDQLESGEYYITKFDLVRNKISEGRFVDETSVKKILKKLIFWE